MKKNVKVTKYCLLGHQQVKSFKKRQQFCMKQENSFEKVDLQLLEDIKSKLYIAKNFLFQHADPSFFLHKHIQILYLSAIKLHISKRFRRKQYGYDIFDSINRLSFANPFQNRQNIFFKQKPLILKVITFGQKQKSTLKQICKGKQVPRLKKQLMFFKNSKPLNMLNIYQQRINDLRKIEIVTSDMFFDGCFLFVISQNALYKRSQNGSKRNENFKDRNQLISLILFTFSFKTKF